MGVVFAYGGDVHRPVAVWPKTATKSTKICNARAQTLFCSKAFFPLTFSFPWASCLLMAVTCSGRLSGGSIFGFQRLEIKC